MTSESSWSCGCVPVETRVEIVKIRDVEWAKGSRKANIYIDQ
jgi:hypothetical protein